MQVLTKRALNRALLDRQALLRRVDERALSMIERLVGMQAQTPGDPYLGLWSRIVDFAPEQLESLLLDRQAVRATTLLRTTIHLASARDALTMRPLLQPVAVRQWQYSGFARALADLDIAEVVASGRDVLADGPLTASDIGTRLQDRWPTHDATALGYAVRFLVDLVQIPPRGLWRQRARPLLDTIEHWLGQPLASDPPIGDLVLRYLRAFGPATVGDIQVWSWLNGMREVVERLRPQLRTFRDDRGRELFDVPDGSLPDPDTPAPVRILPEFDNLILSHDDRTRVLDRKFGSGGWLRGSVLVDGFVAATWRTDRKADRATITVRPFAALPPNDRRSVEDEAELALRFLEPDAVDRGVAFVDA